eukprot:ANDGO_03704.mRNA.1 Rho guanine nucleotide exchange factor
MTAIETRVSDLESRVNAISEKITDKIAVEFLNRCFAMGIRSARIKRCPSHYYDMPLSSRKEFLGAPAENYLCKSMIVSNQAIPLDQPCPQRYILVVLPYTAKMNSPSLNRSIRLEVLKGALRKPQVYYSLAPDAESLELSGYIHNAVTPIGMKCKIPVIVAKEIADLGPDARIWMGGGEVDLKLQIAVGDLAKLADFVFDITQDRTPSEDQD